MFIFVCVFSKSEFCQSIRKTRGLSGNPIVNHFQAGLCPQSEPLLSLLSTLNAASEVDLFLPDWEAAESTARQAAPTLVLTSTKRRLTATLRHCSLPTLRYGAANQLDSNWRLRSWRCVASPVIWFARRVYGGRTFETILRPSSANAQATFYHPNAKALIQMAPQRRVYGSMGKPFGRHRNRRSNPPFFRLTRSE